MGALATEFQANDNADLEYQQKEAAGQYSPRVIDVQNERQQGIMPIE